MVKMTMATNINSLNMLKEETFRKFQAQQNEPLWVQSHRQAAWDSMNTLPLPTLKDESWRRTDIRALNLEEYQVPGTYEGISKLVDFRKLEKEAKDRFELGKSHGVFLMSRDSLPHGCVGCDKLPEGVVFDYLENQYAKRSELLQKFYGKAVPAGESKFISLHYAYQSGGVILYVPDNIKVDIPLNFYSLITQNQQADFSHVLVVMGRNSEATFVRRTSSLEKELQGFHCGVVELHLLEGAKLHYVDIQDWNENTWHFSTQRAFLAKDSNLEWVAAGIGGKVGKTDSNTHLKAEGARVEMLGLVCVNGTQHLDYHTLQDHDAPNAASDLLYNCVLDDKARSVFRGMIHVHPHAQKTDAYQKNNNLSLNSDARADSIPGLEISANDVRCTHGSTTREIDAEEIFYLMSRGISREKAENLIVEGFFETVLQRMSSEPVKDVVRTLILRKLGLEHLND